MWPRIGIGELRTYIPVYVLAMAAHALLGRRYSARMGIPRKVAFALSVCFVLGMTVGAKVLYDLLHQRFDWRNYPDIRYQFTDGMWGGPLAYLALAATGILILGRDRRALFDLAALTLPIPMILAKVACFCNGCCYGAESNLPWAVTFAPGAEAPAGIARHPTQLFEILVLVVVLFVFQRLDRERWKGMLVIWFVLLYGLGRPLTEFFRDAAERPPFFVTLTSSQVVCLFAAIVALIVLWVLRPLKDHSNPSPAPMSPLFSPVD